MKSYEAIVIGAGSLGTPIALSLGEKGVKTLVLDRHPSPGQGENKHAIGGIRATHSDPAKILTCLRSLEIFSTWEEERGDDIEWLKGGYAFPVYRETEEKALKEILPLQKQYGLNIDFVGPEVIREIVPGINPHGLLGGTFSPDDGSASPLLAINAFYKKASELGAEFRFKEKVTGFKIVKGYIKGVKTNRGQYKSPIVIDAAGPFSRPLADTLGVDLPVIPDAHEAAITEPVHPFFKTMVVDLRPGPGSKNYYFYQNKRGQIVCCITPNPPIVGMDKGETSTFLPQICARMVGLMPRLRNLRVRRVWRGLYPMTPDGFPFVGWSREYKGLLHATGMCGQGYMLGPGLGEIIASMVLGKTNETDKMILKAFSPYRDFHSQEALK